jgi:hypothetical protein
VPGTDDDYVIAFRVGEHKNVLRGTRLIENARLRPREQFPKIPAIFDAL